MCIFVFVLICECVYAIVYIGVCFVSVLGTRCMYVNVYIGVCWCVGYI